MSNSNTVAPVRSKRTRSGDGINRHLSHPTQVSNAEFIPLPQTRKQSAVKNELLEIGTRISKKLAIARRPQRTGSAGIHTFLGLRLVRVPAPDSGLSAKRRRLKISFSCTQEEIWPPR